MFPWYGYIGLLFVALGEILIFLKIEPFTTYLFFLCLWIGYILIVDAWVLARTKSSRLKNNHCKFWLLFLLSAIFWWFYELLNYFIENWRYEGVGEPQWIMYTLAFSTVLPAIIETSDLLRSFSIFQRLKWRVHVNKRKVCWLILIGIICLILPFVVPYYAYSLVWLSMFFLLDPINFMMKSPSILEDLKRGRATIFWSLMIGALICGFFWEFWNYWAPAKWFYDVPVLGFLKIFEMPILGYLGYMPFGLSLYAMYNFSLSLFRKK